MPYIPQEDRQRLYPETLHPASKPGQLNYQITELINSYVRQLELSYATINDIIGALESAKLEFYSRVARPYEDKKIAENGDVYSGDAIDG